MNKQIHITALAPYKIFPADTGGQRNITLFYKYLCNRISIDVIGTKDNVPTNNLAYTLTPLLTNSFFRYLDLSLFFRIRRVLKEKQSSHFMMEHPYFGWLGILLKRFCNVKLIIHSHNIEALRFKSTGKYWWKILWYYERLAHQNADISFFITEEDRLFAIRNYGLAAEKCFVTTYGTETRSIPGKEERQEARKKLNELYPELINKKILFFNGNLSYQPNIDAVDIIRDKINPLLQQQADFNYSIIIAGAGLPNGYDDSQNRLNKNIIFTGFVKDINVIFKASDIFINPVLDGGGIKTKLVEALENNVTAVSTTSGAFGISEKVAGKKLAIMADNDWEAFVAAIFSSNIQSETPTTFYNHFYWGNIAEHAAAIIEKS